MRLANALFNRHKRIFPQRPMPDNPLSRALEGSDILVYRFSGPKSFLGGVIACFTNSPYSHAEIHVSDGVSVSAEATGVGYKDIFAKENYVDLFRLKEGLSREARLIIAAKAHQSVFKPYHYANLFLFPFLSKKRAAKWAKNDAFICSEVTSWCYLEAGYDLAEGKPEAMEAPADIARSPLLDYEGTYNTKTGKFVEAEARKLMPHQKFGWLSKLVCGWMKALSERDENY